MFLNSFIAFQISVLEFTSMQKWSRDLLDTHHAHILRRLKSADEGRIKKKTKSISKLTGSPGNPGKPRAPFSPKRLVEITSPGSP